VAAEGKIWESRAEQFLLSQGLVLIARNFSTRSGEIDLIMRDNSHIAFVEVRYRNTIRFGGAIGSVTRAKQQKLIKCARAFLVKNPTWATHPCRFDVIAYDASGGGQPQWFRAAFD
jgi:putative endonuclease